MVSNEIFALPFISEDGNEIMVATKYNGAGAYFKFLVKEIPKSDGKSIFESASELAISMFENRE